MTPPLSTQHPDVMASSISVRSYTTSRQPSFSSRSLMDTSRARSRASVSFMPSSPLSRPASAGSDLNGPMAAQVNSVHGNSTNDKEAMQNLNNRLASYLDKVRAGPRWTRPQRVTGGPRSPNLSQHCLTQVRSLERSNADLEAKIKQVMIERIPKGHDLDSMMAQAHAVEQEVEACFKPSVSLWSKFLPKTYCL